MKKYIWIVPLSRCLRLFAPGYVGSVHSSHAKRFAARSGAGMHAHAPWRHTSSCNNMLCALGNSSLQSFKKRGTVGLWTSHWHPTRLATRVTGYKRGHRPIGR
jgi:hypothetical protein